jgi:hypothetical protein
MGNSIPKLLPASTLSCPPSNSYIKQYIATGNNNNMLNQKSQSLVRLESTAPNFNNNINFKNNNLLSTDALKEKNYDNKQLNLSPSAPNIIKKNNFGNQLNDNKNVKKESPRNSNDTNKYNENRIKNNNYWENRPNTVREL